MSRADLMRAKHNKVQGMREEIERLEALIEYWKGYPCKFHCRTARQNFTDGFKEAVSNNNYRVCDADEVYNKYKERDDARASTSSSKR